MKDQPPNFLPVLQCLAEPTLRLWISAHMSREYEHGEFEIVVEHDPELRPDALLRPLSFWHESLWRSANPGRPAPEAEPNKSVEAVKLASFGVTHTFVPGEVRLLMRHAYQSLGARASRLEQALDLSSRGSGFQLIVDILKASVRLPVWDYQAQVEVRHIRGHVLSSPPRQWISLYLERDLAVELAASSNLSLEGAADDLLLASREARVD